MNTWTLTTATGALWDYYWGGHFEETVKRNSNRTLLSVENGNLS